MTSVFGVLCAHKHLEFTALSGSILKTRVDITKFGERMMN
jgi:hypothetical protein